MLNNLISNNYTELFPFFVARYFLIFFLPLNSKHKEPRAKNFSLHYIYNWNRLFLRFQVYNDEEL